jgi:TfoX/Sxy family transcriptional regulator of competence genes
MAKNIKVSDDVFRALVTESRDRKVTVKDLTDSILEDQLNLENDVEEAENEEEEDAED